MTKTATDLFHEYYALKPAERINSNVQDYVFDHQQKRIDELQRQLDTANFFRNGDSATIGNATNVIKEMRSRIDELQKKLTQVKSITENMKHREFVSDYGKNAAMNIAAEINVILRGEHE